MGLRFNNFIQGYFPHFQRGSRSVGEQAEEYLKGLFQASGKKNMERMVEVVPFCDYQALQHFLSHSQWDARAVLDQLAVEADSHLGGSADTGFFIDESGFAKKGEKSVGVARQWNGRLGKVDNSQVAVFACLGQGPYATLINTRLYLPKEWVLDPERCREAGVPEQEAVYKSKADLAFEMVVGARQNGVRFSWVGMDGGYGKDPDLLRRLEDSGEVFMTDVHKDQQVYVVNPNPAVPERNGKRGEAWQETDATQSTECQTAGG
jgi:SRSO17 transposase